MTYAINKIDDILSEKALNDIIEDLTEDADGLMKDLSDLVAGDLSDDVVDFLESVTEILSNGMIGVYDDDDFEISDTPSETVPSDKQREKDAYKKSMGIV